MFSFAVNLCQPTMVVLRGNVPDDHEAWQIFYEVETGLVNALPAFADSELFRIFDRKIKEHFDKVDNCFSLLLLSKDSRNGNIALKKKGSSLNGFLL